MLNRLGLLDRATVGSDRIDSQELLDVDDETLMLRRRNTALMRPMHSELNASLMVVTHDPRWLRAATACSNAWLSDWCGCRSW